MLLEQKNAVKARTRARAALERDGTSVELERRHVH